MSQSFPVQTTYRDNVLRVSMLIVRKIECNRETRQTLMLDLVNSYPRWKTTGPAFLCVLSSLDTIAFMNSPK